MLNRQGIAALSQLQEWEASELYTTLFEKKQQRDSNDNSLEKSGSRNDNKGKGHQRRSDSNKWSCKQRSPNDNEHRRQRDLKRHRQRPLSRISARIQQAQVREAVPRETTRQEGSISQSGMQDGGARTA